MQKYKENLLNEIKDHTHELAEHFLRHSPDGKFICPFCGNGSGENGTGVEMSQHGNHCFVCDASFTIFQAIQAEHKCSFQEAVKNCADFLSISTESSANTNFDSALNSQKALSYLKSRALDDKSLIEKFSIAYDAKTDCIVIPHENNFCTRRYIGTNTTKPRFNYLKGVKIALFNSKALVDDAVVFVTEGAIDALSIIKAGGQAVAIGGVSNTKLLLNELKTRDVKPILVVLMDNDEAGNKAAKKLLKGLEKLQIRAFKSNIPAFNGNDKIDANDLLIHDPKALSYFLENTISQAKKINSETTYITPDVDLAGIKRAKSLPELPAFLNLKIEDFEIPQNFAVLNGAMYTLDKDGNLSKFSNSVIFVVKEIVNVDENIYRTQLACCRNGRKWVVPHAFDNSTIASTQKIVSLSDFGIDVNSINAKTMVKYLDAFKNVNFDVIPVANSANQTGWREDNEFVYPNDNDGKYILDDTLRPQLEKVFATEGDRKNVLPLIHKIKDVDVANINLGAVLAAPLVDVLRCDNIVVHTYGLAGSGKTTMNYLLFSLFGNPNADEAIPTADATRVGLENYFAGRHDLPAIVEDINSISDKRAKATIQKLPFQFGNSKGRLRGKPKGGNQKLIDFRGSLLTNDEKPLTTDTSAGGGKRRVIELKTPNEMFDIDLVSDIDDVIRENYGLFGRDWIETVKKNRGTIKEMYDEIRRGTEEAPGLQKEFVNKVPRHVQSISAIITANIFFDVYFLNMSFEDALSKEMSCAIRILQTLPDKNEIADFERAKPIIINWFLQHRKKFADDTNHDEESPPYNETKSFEEYGIIKKNIIAVNTTVFRKMLQENEFSPDIVIRQLIEDGFLVRNGKNLEKLVRVRGLDKPIWMTCINKAPFEESPSE